MGGPVMRELPPMAFEWDNDRNMYAPVEARPCGDHLVVVDGNVDLRCDLPEGHMTRDHTKHRAIIDRARGHYVNWCNGRCSDPCVHVKNNVLPFLQRVRRSPE